MVKCNFALPLFLLFSNSNNNNLNTIKINKKISFTSVKMARKRVHSVCENYENLKKKQKFFCQYCNATFNKIENLQNHENNLLHLNTICNSVQMRATWFTNQHSNIVSPRDPCLGETGVAHQEFPMLVLYLLSSAYRSVPPPVTSGGCRQWWLQEAKAGSSKC